MSQEEKEFEVSPQEEMKALKERANLLGISYHPSIGLDKLREKVNASIDGAGVEDSEEEPEEKAVVKETEGQRRKRLKDAAARMIRIRVACMNPAKKDWEGEIFSAGNTVVGTFKKFVPFNAEDGWHVPYIIYEMMRDRECPIYVQTKTQGLGNTRKQKLVKEFAIEVLPELTTEELKELARRQAMAAGQSV